MLRRQKKPELVRERLFGRTVYSHGGGINGFSSQMLWFPDTETFIVVLANVDTAPTLEISRGMAAIVSGEPYTLPAVHEAVPVDPALLQ